MKLAAFLGEHVSRLLGGPCAGWPVTRSVSLDLAKGPVSYEFPEHGVDALCDADERVRTIFVRRGLAEGLVELPFASSRQEVFALLGAPSKSGRASQDAILGPSGAWDRFARPSCVVHVQYRLDADAIQMVTLMRAEVAR